MKPRIEPLEDRLAPALSCFADVTASFSASVVPNPAEWSDTTAMVADDAIAPQQILQPSNFATSLGDYPSIDAAVIADDAAVMQKAYDSENFYFSAAGLDTGSIDKVEALETRSSDDGVINMSDAMVEALEQASQADAIPESPILDGQELTSPVDPESSEDLADSVRNELDSFFASQAKNEEPAQETAHFNIQELISAYNQAETLVTELLKASQETDTAVISKIG